MKKCPVCNENIRGRSDKKFCSSYCRASFHNERNADANNYMRNINNRLRKNRRILQNLWKLNNSKVNKARMIDRGFNFNYYTHEEIISGLGLCRFCYDYGYRVNKAGQMIILHRNAVLDMTEYSMA